MPKVSVIIPVYNAEKYLASTLDSVLVQTLSDIEIICVNDGSTDASGQILERFQQKDKRIKIVDQENSGGSAARNTGMQQATGEYLMFIDSDDLYVKDSIESAYNRASESGADIVFYNFARFVGKPTKLAVVNKTVPSSEQLFFTKETYRERFFNDLAIITWNKIVKRSVITNNNLLFDTTLSHNHDVDFSVRLMLAANSYSWLDKVGYYYRSNEGGLTATKRSDPTNVLKILLDLNRLVDSEYQLVKPSFNNYIADMIAGTILKYSNDANKVRQIFDYTREVLIPQAGISSVDGRVSEPTGIFSLVERGNYKELENYLNNTKLKARKHLRGLYDAVQGVIARIAV